MDRELRLAKKRAWYQANKHRIREKQREQNKRSYRKYREERRMRGREYTKMLWATKPDEMRIKSREAAQKWRTANPDKKKFNVWKSVIKKKFGLTPEQYQQMSEQQNNVCSICEKPDRHSRLAVDHNHDTGEVRGLLCRGCNVALGKFGDDPKLVSRALIYLVSAADRQLATEERKRP